jgi:hypothetical protein
VIYETHKNAAYGHRSHRRFTSSPRSCSGPRSVHTPRRSAMRARCHALVPKSGLPDLIRARSACRSCVADAAVDLMPSLARSRSRHRRAFPLKSPVRRIVLGDRERRSSPAERALERAPSCRRTCACCLE